jgi:hypothetical protein
VDAEAALGQRQFAAFRASSAWPGRPLSSMTFDELDVLWARAKREEADERETSA